ncbi:MAG: hypothetical protein HZC01_00640 [Candidatus Kerfeldbacteria bacterium]|nr:hypothetical protein [Candidatus Kerfeldbacteria bacterium]
MEDLVGNLISWISAVATIYGILLAVVLAFIGFITFKLRKEAVDELKELREIKKEAERQYLLAAEEIKKAKAEYSKLYGETKQKSDKYFQEVYSAFDRVNDLIHKLEEREKELTKKGKKKARKEDELARSLEEVKKLRNELVHSMYSAATISPTVSGLGTTFSANNRMSNAGVLMGDYEFCTSCGKGYISPLTGACSNCGVHQMTFRNNDNDLESNTRRFISNLKSDNDKTE